MRKVFDTSLTQEANEIADACDREIRQIQSFLIDRSKGVAGDLVLAYEKAAEGVRLRLYSLLEVISDGELVTTPVRIDNPSRIFGEQAGTIRPDDSAAVLVSRAVALANIHNRLLTAAAEIDDTLDEAFALDVVSDHGVEVELEGSDEDGEWYRTGDGATEQGELFPTS